MDKKKSKLVGIVDDDVGTNNDNKFKDIRIERTDEFGRIVRTSLDHPFTLHLLLC